MWGLIIAIVFFIIGTINYFRVIKWGGNIFNPDLEKVDNMFREKTGITGNWNTKTGRVLYYVYLIGFSFAFFFIIYLLVL
ncbi:MAG: hypothetical protein ACOYEA_05810 [Fermentimonas sp.]|jgi:hypothetical protein